MPIFNDPSGKTSSSRITSFSIIMIALVLSVSIVVVGIIIALSGKQSASALLTAATAAGTLFVTMGGASMYFMYSQKKGEIKAMANVIEATNKSNEYNYYPNYNECNHGNRKRDDHIYDNEPQYDGTPIIE